MRLLALSRTTHGAERHERVALSGPSTQAPVFPGASIFVKPAARGRGSSQGILYSASQHLCRSICLASQDRSSEPTPVDAVVDHLWAVKVHHLNEVDLIAVGHVARVFPKEGATVEQPAASTVPAHKFVGPVVGAALEERPDLFASGQDAALDVQ